MQREMWPTRGPWGHHSQGMEEFCFSKKIKTAFIQGRLSAMISVFGKLYESRFKKNSFCIFVM